MPYADRDGLDDVKADEHYAEDEALVKNGINERSMAETGSQFELFTN